MRKIYKVAIVGATGLVGRTILLFLEEKNFTNAAKKLFISQPSLSKSIKLLEEELGVELFERNPIKLTHAGEA